MTATELLLFLNLNPSHKGFGMLAELIALRSSDPTCKLMALYAAVGKRLKVSSACVERDSRFAIISALDHHGCDRFIELLKQPPDLEGGYTNSRFIALAAYACAESRR